MLQETNVILFLTASLALIVAPGPDNFLVLTCGGAAPGPRPGLRVAHLDTLQRRRLLLGEPRQLARGRPKFADALRWLIGSVLIGLGLRLALPERR